MIKWNRDQSLSKVHYICISISMHVSNMRVKQPLQTVTPLNFYDLSFRQYWEPKSSPSGSIETQYEFTMSNKNGSFWRVELQCKRIKDSAREMLAN